MFLLKLYFRTLVPYCTVQKAAHYVPISSRRLQMVQDAEKEM